MSDIVARMTSGDLAKSVPEAENMCELHKERKVSGLENVNSLTKIVSMFTSVALRTLHVTNRALHMYILRFELNKEKLTRAGSEPATSGLTRLGSTN